MTAKVKIHPVQMIPVKDLVPNPWNPNEMDELLFNALADSIQDVGFVENIQVVPIGVMSAEFQSENPDRKYVIIGGEHRTTVVRLLDEETELPCVVLEENDVDKLKAQTVSMQVIKGDLNPAKMTQLFKEMSAKYGDDRVKEWMHFGAREELFKKVVKTTKQKLPKEMQDKFEQYEEEVKTIDDLALVLNKMFTEYGDTVEYSFMAFTWGGKMHYLIRMDKTLKNAMSGVHTYCVENAIDINDVLTPLLAGAWKDRKRYLEE